MALLISTLVGALGIPLASNMLYALGLQPAVVAAGTRPCAERGMP